MDNHLENFLPSTINKNNMYVCSCAIPINFMLVFVTPGISILIQHNCDIVTHYSARSTVISGYIDTTILIQLCKYVSMIIMFYNQ